MKIWPVVCTICLICILSGCGPTVTVKHEIEPIHLTIDINIRIQKELEDFFAFEKTRSTSDKAEKSAEK